MPYISIVIACRNDNYTRGFLKKFLISLSILFKQISKYNLDAEIVIVEWNPPKENRKLSSILRDIKVDKSILRVIEVDSLSHNQCNFNKDVHFPPVLATNVGIRRAQGQFIMSKAADTILSDELVEYISKKNLSQNSVYRADRVNVKIDENEIDENWQNYFERNIFYRGVNDKKGPHIKACGDFMLMYKDSWKKIRGYPEPKLGIGHGEDSEALFAAIGIGLEQICLDGKMVIYKNFHSNQYSERLKINHKNFYRKIYKISNISFSNFISANLKRIIILLAKLTLGILNLPKTSVFGIRVRSQFRFYLIATLRINFGGMNFIRDKNWGLASKKFKETLILVYKK